MAPTAAMALNGTRDLRPYAFIRLSGCFSHAGSVYAFSGVTLGPRAGFFSGWALLGTYLAITAASTAEAGLFGGGVLPGLGDLGRRRVAGHRARGGRPDRVLRPGTIGVLSLLVAYIVTNVGALRFLFIAAGRAPLWQVVIPIVAIAFLGFTIYKN